jgi:hypothetical protein
VADGGGVDSKLKSWLERGDDEMKRCLKMKWWQQARLGSMGKKRDTHDGVATSAGGEVATERGKVGDDNSWANVNLTGQKMIKIHTVHSATTNGR